EPAYTARDFAHHRALDLVLRRALGEIIGEDLIEALRHEIGIDARLHLRLDGEDSGSLQRLEIGADANCNLLVADHDLVEARAGEAAQHGRSNIDRGKA